MADVAVVIGHHPDAPGATLQLGGRAISEYELWAPFGRELTWSLRQQDVDAVRIERPSPQADQALMRKVNRTGADAAIELHFNASEGEAWGTEMLHYPGSEEGKALAARLQAQAVKALSLRDRGIRAREDLAFLSGTEMPAVICEPAFGDQEEDAWRLLTRQMELVRGYRMAITEHMLDG